MANQLIDFEQGSLTTGDSGEREDIDAIKPIDNGESLSASVLDRPSENLRQRSEFLRTAVEELFYRADVDKWIITGGDNIGAVTGSGAASFPPVQWDATTGIFILGEDIVIQPIIGPETDKFASKVYSFTDGIPNTATFTFGSNRFDYQNGNNLRIIWEEKDPADLAVYGGFCAAFFEGTPEHILRIWIRNDSATQATNVDAKLTALFVGPDDPFTYGGMGGIGATFLLAAPTPPDDDYLMNGSYSREMHHLPAAQVAAFFGGAALLTDGDTLGIYYPYLTDPDAITRGGRRQATIDTLSGGVGPAPNTGVIAGQLFLASVNPEYIPYSIPLCRRIGTYVVFVDGTVVAHSQSVLFGQCGTIWEELASTVGALAIGSSVIAGSPDSVIAGTVRSQLVAIVALVNARARIASAERITATWDMFSDTNGIVDDAHARIRGEVLHGTILGGSFPRDATLPYIARKLGNEVNLCSPSTDANTIALGVGLAGSALIVRDSISYTGRQRRLLAFVDRVTGVADSGEAGSCYLVDPQDTATVVANPTLGSLPTGSGETWTAIACCSNGPNLFVLFNNVAPGAAFTEWRVQAYDATSNLMPKVTAWPATGIAVGGGVLGPEGGGTNIPRTCAIAMVSHTQVVTVNGWVLLTAPLAPALTIFNAADGSGVTSGDGGVVSPAASRVPTGGICSDGVNIYWTSQLGANPYTSDLECTLVSDITAVRPGWMGYNLGVASGAATNFCPSLACTGDGVYAPLEDGNCIALDTASASPTATSFTAHTSMPFLSHAVFDGLRIWLIGRSSNQHVAAMALDGFAYADVTGATLDIAGAKIISLVTNTEALAGAVNATDIGPAIWDGDGIWCILNDEKGIGSVPKLGYIRAIRASSRR